MEEIFVLPACVVPVPPGYCMYVMCRIPCAQVPVKPGYVCAHARIFRSTSSRCWFMLAVASTQSKVQIWSIRTLINVIKQNPPGCDGSFLKMFTHSINRFVCHILAINFNQRHVNLYVFTFWFSFLRRERDDMATIDLMPTPRFFRPFQSDTKGFFVCKSNYRFFNVVVRMPSFSTAGG
jgi:hypothetical protein